jgi:recombinational DNA repair protein (RecF pathway)
MSYHIYTTEGIILKRGGFGESNVVLHVLTRDLGLIIASAQSARLEVSKLRGHLQEYSLVSLSCVKGRSGWKATSASIADNFFFNHPAYSHAALAKVSQLLLQMIAGESAHAEIFDLVRGGFEFLGSLKEEDMGSFETLIVLRILFLLGYVARNSDTERLLAEPNVWNQDLLIYSREKRQNLIELINTALKESQL